MISHVASETVVAADLEAAITAWTEAPPYHGRRAMMLTDLAGELSEVVEVSSGLG